MNNIIISLLDTDTYKLSMQQAVLELFPDARVTYRFKNRGRQRFNQDFLQELQNQINSMSNLALTHDEYSWLQAHIPFFKPVYLEYLKNYRFNPEEIKCGLTSDNDLELEIEGPWHSTILWEVSLMAVISELYFKMIDTDWNSGDQIEKAKSKAYRLCAYNCRFGDFGTRRRRDFETQDNVVYEFKNYSHSYFIKYDHMKNTFIGTSNVYLAMKHGVKPVGTMAHEWFMAISVLEGLRNANYYALQDWVRVYNADLGIALTDTYTLPSFLRNFNLRLAKLYDGVRHDSGNPLVFADKIIKHYAELGIDPLTKAIIFSDGLDVETAIKIKEHCRGKIKCSFGIGTHFTNDFENSKALNMVIKLWSCEDIPVVKLSDTPGKVMGDPKAVEVARWMHYR